MTYSASEAGQTAYSKMVERIGVEAAKAEMSRRRALVKTPGLANIKSKRKRSQVAKKAWETKRQKEREDGGVEPS